MLPAAQPPNIQTCLCKPPHGLKAPRTHQAAVERVGGRVAQRPNALYAGQLRAGLLDHADAVAHYAQRPVAANARARYHLPGQGH